MTVRLLVSALLLAIASPAVLAQKIYKCKDEKGSTFYSQAYDPKRCTGGGSQMNADGIAVKTIERQKTPEELAAEKIAAEKAAAERRAIESQRNADNVLIQSYPSEADLARAHQQQVAAIDGVVKTTELSIASHSKSLDELLAVAAESERAKTPVPENIVASIENVREELEKQREIIAGKEREKVALEAEYEKQLARYRAIKARQEKQLSGQ